MYAVSKPAGRLEPPPLTFSTKRRPSPITVTLAPGTSPRYDPTTIAVRIFLLLTLSLLCLGIAPQGELVVAKPGTGLYHRPGCDVVRGATDVLAMTVGQAETRGYKSHPECDPSVVKPTPAVPQATPEARAKRPAPIYVFVNEAGTRYHRDGCRTLEKPAKKVLLDAATAKKYWPCHICRPPILPRAKK